MLVFLTADAKGQYSLDRPRKLESLLDASTYSATMQRFNSIPSGAQSQWLIHLCLALGIMIFGGMVPVFRGSHQKNDAIDLTCTIFGITIGSIWTIFATYKMMQREKAKRQQLQVMVDEVDREYEQLSIAAGRPRICWSLINLFGQQNNNAAASSYAKHIQIEVCCPHLMQHMNQPHLQPVQLQSQVQVVAAVPIYQLQQPQYYPQHQQHRDVELSIAAPSRNSQSASTAHYHDLENPLLG